MSESNEKAQIILKHGIVCLIDEQDYDMLSQHKWYLKLGKYAMTTINRKNYTMHRMILGLTDRKILVDHINGNGLDNRKANLRTCNSQENIRNTRKHRGSSKYKGVCWDKYNKKWKSSIVVDLKHISLGNFLDEEVAARAYDKAAIERFGEFAWLNFPKQALKPTKDEDTGR